jgi:hypothetical protein
MHISILSTVQRFAMAVFNRYQIRGVHLLLWGIGLVFSVQHAQ